MGLSDAAGVFMDAAATPSFFLGRQRHPLIFPPEQRDCCLPACLLLLAYLSSELSDELLAARVGFTIATWNVQYNSVSERESVHAGEKSAAI